MAPMEPNPYKAPQQPDGLRESSGQWNQDQAIQLLTEIRDCHREALALTRDALNKQKRIFRFLTVVIVFLLLLFSIPIAGLIFSIVSPPPTAGPRPPSGSASPVFP